MGGLFRVNLFDIINSHFRKGGALKVLASILLKISPRRLSAKDYAEIFCMYHIQNIPSTQIGNPQEVYFCGRNAGIGSIIKRLPEIEKSDY
jgi:hypothetical protein